jgi:hypothetical protein
MHAGKEQVPLSIKAVHGWRGGGNKLQWHLHDPSLPSANFFHSSCLSLEFFPGLPQAPASCFLDRVSLLPTYRMHTIVLTGWKMGLTPPPPSCVRIIHPRFRPHSLDENLKSQLPQQLLSHLRLLQIYPSRGRTDKRVASSNIDGTDAGVLHAQSPPSRVYPSCRAPHRIVNVTTHLRRGTAEYMCVSTAIGKPKLAVTCWSGYLPR